MAYCTLIVAIILVPKHADILPLCIWVVPRQTTDHGNFPGYERQTSIVMKSKILNGMNVYFFE